jgi:hypothetical protein
MVCQRAFEKRVPQMVNNLAATLRRPSLSVEDFWRFTTAPLAVR